MKEGEREDEVDGAAQGKPPKTCHLLQEISPLGVICLEPNVASGALWGYAAACRSSILRVIH